MRCEQVRSLLNEYCEGSLNEAMRERVEAHLRVCAACQREVQFVQAIWRGLAAMPEVVPPPDLHARIMTYVRANTRAREAQGRVAFWRWAGAAAAAAGLFIMGFFAAQSDGVQAAFGFGAPSKPPAQTLQPVQAGVFLEYRTTADGARIPVLEARMNREATAELRYMPESDAKTEPIVVWSGRLQPGKTVEIPLQALLHASGERVLTLQWTLEGRSRVLYVPAGYPPAKLASLRLQAKLGDALRQLASAYQTPIEWVPNGEEPLVVLDVQDATLEDALQKLLIGSNYTLKRHSEFWRVVSR
jgi:hypothetical protein